MSRSYDIAILSQKVEQMEGSIKANDVVANPTGDTSAELKTVQIDGTKYSIAPNRVKSFLIENDYVFNNAQVIEVGNLSTLTSGIVTKTNLKGACVIGTSAALFTVLDADESILKLAATTTVNVTIHARIILFYEDAPSLTLTRSRKKKEE